MPDQTPHADLLSLTTEIVSSHVSNNTVAQADISSLIEQVFRTLSGLGGHAPISADRPQPAVPIKKSVTPEYIVCLEDGKKLKMLKRHLKTAYDMTPEEYRERYHRGEIQGGGSDDEGAMQNFLNEAESRAYLRQWLEAHPGS